MRARRWRPGLVGNSVSGAGKMKRILIVFSFMCLAGASCGRAEPRTLSLSEKMDGFFSLPALKGADCAVKIARLRDGKTVFQKQGDVLLCPASLVKIFTAAAALRTLKPEYTFRTAVYGDGKLKQGTYEGNVYIKGFGDPTLVEERVFRMAESIRDKGIRRIQGGIYLDASFFDDKKFAEGWDSPSRRWYHAPIGALSVNFNAYQRGGSWYAIESDPLDHAAGIIRTMLKAGGVRLAAGAITGRPVPAKAREILVVESQRLSSVLMDMNKFSSNFIAEQIVKTMGAEVLGPPGTTEKGLRVIRDFIAAELKISADSYTLTDGSGLSRLDRLTPSQIVRLLLSVYDDFEIGSEFRASLKIAGAEGADWLFQQPDVKRKMRVKTGHLQGVDNLAGYASTKEGEVLAFAVFINGCKAERAVSDRALEKFAALLTGLSAAEIEEGVEVSAAASKETPADTVHP
jgi:D-alanyl-D-alanine carboxypeptidase/D-alanyl-D-alanine-endopeptidase (penicillin-binding protein 4)